MKQTISWDWALEQIRECSTEIVSPEICDEPLVSVCFLAYQHRPYIEQAVESVLAQETGFPFEVVIGEDGSNDGTAEILERYQAENKDKIRLFRSSPNLGGLTGNGRLNLIRTVNACRGKYIALLEGDDYWTDPKKLAKQVAGLENHPECRAVAHRTDVLWEIQYPGRYRPCHFDDGQILRVEDTLTSGRTPFHTSSFLFEPGLLDHWPSWLLNSIDFDRLLYTYVAAQTSILFFTETMSVYRKHLTGSTNTSDFRSLKTQLDQIKLMVDMGAELRLGRLRPYRRVILGRLYRAGGRVLRTRSISSAIRLFFLGVRGIVGLIR